MTNIKQDQNLSKIQGENQSTNLTCASPAWPSKKQLSYTDIGRHIYK